MENGEILRLSGITKSFPGVLALADVDFALKQGEIHALMGENGAGKSTLIKVLTGVHKRDSGVIEYLGDPIDVRSPLHAQELGISTVYQEVNLVPNLSVAENLFLGRQPMRAGRIAWRSINEQAVEILARFDLDIDVRENLGRYTVAVQQMVAIARALELHAKVLILDEPTSSLNIEEVEKLFQQMRRLKQEGQAIIFITHFVDQAFQISDRITVLRNGRYIGTYPTREISKVDLISKLLGREYEKLTELAVARTSSEEAAEAEAFVRTEDLGRKGSIKPFSVKISKGKVVGCAGLLGSGRTELANVLFGIEAADSGTLYVGGRELKISNPGKAMRHGIGLSPEDRKEQGIVPQLSVRENIALALQVRRGWFKNLSSKEQKEIAERYIELLGIKTPSTEQLMGNLSGGNQQKVIIARWLASDPQFLILDEPTRGIDVGAKTEIQKLVVELAQKNLAVLFISSEIEEIARCSSEVLVLHNREVVETLHGKDINDQNIMNAIAERHVEGGTDG
ncbi:MAG: sugar ABC transporter ATP-binding protein [Spirochaetales bacterium]|nr:sugar ABC transporter ATP-binding protein [Spirochaetales bacterium]